MVRSRGGGAVKRSWLALAAFALLSFLLVAPPMARAVIETYTFSRPDLEARYHALSQELRCPKCQNQNIADSNAPIAKDLRFLLHAKLEQGASDEEILTFMVDRYGEFVRYRPAVDSKTWVLWFGPGIMALGGLLLLFRQLGQSRSTLHELDDETLQGLRDRVAARKSTQDEPPC